MDATQLEYDDESFDVILDKGTLDALIVFYLFILILIYQSVTRV